VTVPPQTDRRRLAHASAAARSTHGGPADEGCVDTLQPPGLPPPVDGATQLPLGSHTFRAAQSLTEAQDLRHRPPEQAYGSHGVLLLPTESCAV
jgi:hypothetical protein